MSQNVFASCNDRIIERLPLELDCIQGKAGDTRVGLITQKRRNDGIVGYDRHTMNQ